MQKSTQSPGKKNDTAISDETILKVAKEITVKFIEVGSVTPTNFTTSFTNIYQTVRKLTDSNK